MDKDKLYIHKNMTLGAMTLQEWAIRIKASKDAIKKRVNMGILIPVEQSQPREVNL